MASAVNHKYYVISGSRYESLSDALERADQIIQQRDKARRGQTTTSKTLVDDTVSVLRSDGTVAATVRP